MRPVLVCFGLTALCAWLAVVFALGADLEMGIEEQQNAIEAASMSFAEQAPVIEALKLTVEDQRETFFGTGLLLTEVCYLRPGTRGYDNFEE